MCNNTSLSHFLEGVNFLDEEMAEIELEEECDFPGDDDCNGTLLTLDMTMEVDDEVLDASASNLELPSETLPPLAFHYEEEDDMDTFSLLVPPEEQDLDYSSSSNTTTTEEPDSTSTQLEKLAHCMRRSEETKFKLAACSSPALAKANPFFTGTRVTITPELEQSRQQLWSFVRMHQEKFMTHKMHFTAAA
jgi:hypothetical protein